MNLGIDLGNVGPAFGDTSVSSQMVFRHCLEVMSQPGRIAELAHDARIPEPMMSATGAIALALLDQDTRAWLSTSFQTEEIKAYLKFHTNCQFASAPQQADFAFIAHSSELPALDGFCMGTDEFPELSTTAVIQVSEVGDVDGWHLSGPGIKHQRRLNVGVDMAGLEMQMSAIRPLYPRGIDLFFVHDTRICCLPRTTSVGK